MELPMAKEKAKEKEKDFGQSGAAAIDTVRAACNRREILILTTSRVKAEGCFSGMEADCFHAAIDASLDDIRDGLRSSELMVRFLAGDRFLEGPVDLLGLGTRFGRRTVKLAFPTSFGRRPAWGLPDREGPPDPHPFQRPQVRLHQGLDDQLERLWRQDPFADRAG
jgi:hypothetical protein